MKYFVEGVNSKVPTISIIVPVYNVENFLQPCLDSIQSQTYTEWECILVDDGSKDRSGAICDEYAQKDSRFHAFHKENGGVSSARNLGVENAGGDWYLFVDSDDLLFEYTLETLASRIRADIDSICGGYIKIDANSGEEISSSSLREYDMLIDREEALIDFYKFSFGDSFNGYLWNRLLKADIIKNNHLRFREDLYIKEDGLFLVQFLCKSINQHAYFSFPIYKYRINPVGVMIKFGKSFNEKSISNLYARCACYKEIKLVSSKEQLLKLAKDSISNMYKILIAVAIFAFFLLRI